MKTLAQIARELEIPIETLYTASKVGKFPVQKIGRDLFVNENSAEFQDWLVKYRARVRKNRP